MGWVVLAMAVGWLGCSGGTSVAMEQAYAGQSIEGGVLAVPPYDIELGEDMADVYFQNGETSASGKPVIEVQLRDQWEQAWPALTYLDSLVFTEEHTGDAPFRITMVDPTRPGRADVKTISIPNDGTVLRYGDRTPEFVLLLEDVWLGNNERVMGENPITEMPETRTWYAVRGEYALWDNRSGRLVQRGQHEVEVTPPGMFSSRSKGDVWREAMSEFVGYVLSATPLGPMRGNAPMPLGEERRSAVDAYRSSIGS